MLPDVQAGLYMLRPPCKSTATPASGRTLTISVAPSFAAKWLLPRLPDFYDPRPDIDVRIMAICTRKTPARQLWGKIHACRARHAGGDRWPWRRARRCRARGGRSGSPATGPPVRARLATRAISSSGRRPVHPAPRNTVLPNWLFSSLRARDNDLSSTQRLPLRLGKRVMPSINDGGCLCGEIRFRTTAEPVRITVCHCTFCQRLTGSAYLVEPIFRREHVSFRGKMPNTYQNRSDGSGKRVIVNFCGRCGTTVCLDLERFPDIVGLCSGTFDDPNWFERDKDNCRHIFIRSAQRGVVLPTGVKLFAEHALKLDGTPNEPVVLSHALTLSSGGYPGRIEG